jgi:hypothetical protein
MTSLELAGQLSRGERARLLGIENHGAVRSGLRKRTAIILCPFGRATGARSHRSRASHTDILGSKPARTKSP